MKYSYVRTHLLDNIINDLDLATSENLLEILKIEHNHWLEDVGITGSLVTKNIKRATEHIQTSQSGRRGTNKDGCS